MLFLGLNINGGEREEQSGGVKRGGAPEWGWPGWCEEEEAEAGCTCEALTAQHIYYV